MVSQGIASIACVVGHGQGIGRALIADVEIAVVGPPRRAVEVLEKDPQLVRRLAGEGVDVLEAQPELAAGPLSEAHDVLVPRPKEVLSRQDVLPTLDDRPSSAVGVHVADHFEGAAGVRVDGVDAAPVAHLVSDVEAVPGKVRFRSRVPWAIEVSFTFDITFSCTCHICLPPYLPTYLYAHMQVWKNTCFYLYLNPHKHVENHRKHKTKLPNKPHHRFPLLLQHLNVADGQHTARIRL